MDQPRWELIKSVVDQALTLQGQERETFIETVCREYPSISTDVIEMLECIEESEREHFLQEVWSDQKNILLNVKGELNEVIKDEAYIGQKIGPYRITEIIGRGGMGTVFKASRADGEFQQEVAIKLINSGIHTDETVQRFLIEREILAGLQHPNIAHLNDGGVTDNGLPYLVMEYIKGEPIDEYCNRHRLTISERLDIFKEVCAAVQFAHNNLIVHRDLKCQNIYVTGNKYVKILDFGIAKLLDPGHQNLSTLETLPGQKIWTPQFAAPEQVRGEHVTVLSDIYSLGILLFKILTDTYPYDLEGKNLAEMEETIKNASLLLPSQAVMHQTKNDEAAANRKTTSVALQNSLRGDLDALVSKAIRKEPEYRYRSAEHLSEDIDRYKSGIPLLAREGTYRYRMNKFIKRHKVGLAAASAFLIVLLLFSGIYTWRITEERNIAQLERDKLEEIVDFITGLFEASNPVQAQGNELTAVDLLDQGVERAETLTDRPVLQAELLSVIGSTYRGMNRPEKATPLLEKALQIQKNYWQSDHADIANTLNTLGSVYWSDKNIEEADQYLAEALEMRRRLYGNNHPEVFTSMNNYALVLKDKGEWDAAEKLYLEDLEARKKYYGDEHFKIGVSLNNLATLLQQRGKYAEAEKYFRESLTIWQKEQGQEHSDVAIALNNLGALLRESGINDEAEQLLLKSLAIREKVYGKDHLKVTYCLNNLALVYMKENRFEEAVQYANRSLQIRQQAHNGTHYNIARTLAILGDIESARNRFPEAESYYLESMNMRLELYSENHIRVAASRKDLGELYLDNEMPSEAESMLRKALTAYNNYYPSGHIQSARLKGMLGSSLLMQSRFEEAESFILEEYNALQNIPGMHFTFIEQSLSRLVDLYDKWQKPKLAEEYRQELASELALNF